MRTLNDLCYLLDDEVGQIVRKGDISPTELDNVYKAVKTMYYIEVIKGMKEYSDDGYSRGRVSSYGDYARKNYARHSKEEKIAELEHMMENASSEEERRAYRDAIRAMEK